MIIVSRFQNHPKQTDENKKILLKRKKQKSSPFWYCLSADSDFLCNEKGLLPLTSYIFDDGKIPLTLTRREADLIAVNNPGKRPPDVLEEIYPWLPKKKYLANAEKGYKLLTSVLKQYAKHFISPTNYCNQKWNTVCNSLRMVSSLETRYYSAWHLPIQDAFILEECRPNRAVISIDFNSMYAFCMQGTFPDPGAFRVLTFNRELKSNELISIGLYRCKLSGKRTDFIRKYNPFRSFFSGRYLGTSLECEISVDLNEFEIEFFKKHFEKIYIEDAIVTDKTIAHPLALEARRSFSRRKNYTSQENKELADREKFFMTLMASSTNRPNKYIKKFAKFEFALDFIKDHFGIWPSQSEPVAAVEKWLSGKKSVAIFQHDQNIAVSMPILYDGSACFSLSQRIIAKSRITMLEKMEHIINYTPSIEICYCNIDSIHLSIPSNELTEVLQKLEPNLTDKMGDFKVKTITSYGLWLEPGRYWLYSNNTINKFKNKGVSDGINPFKEYKIYIVNHNIDDLHIPVKTSISIANTLSDAKGLTQDLATNLYRQSHPKISKNIDFKQVLSQLKQNRTEVIQKKLAALHQLKVKFQETQI
jgi:hypothetical protein